MDARRLALVVFLVLTVALASLALSEYTQASNLSSELSHTESAPARTMTLTSTTTSVVQCPPDSACGSFTYAPSDPLLVDSVQAIIDFPPNAGGEQDVTFAVTIDNTGGSPVYFEPHSLNVLISSNSTIRRETCNCGLGVSGVIPLNPGQNFTMYNPNADDPYFYALLQGGDVNVNFTIDWTTSSQAGVPLLSNSTTVAAELVFTPPLAR
jgi:hypothetical protein